MEKKATGSRVEYLLPNETNYKNGHRKVKNLLRFFIQMVSCHPESVDSIYKASISSPLPFTVFVIFNG